MRSSFWSSMKLPQHVMAKAIARRDASRSPERSANDLRQSLLNEALQAARLHFGWDCLPDNFKMTALPDSSLVIINTDFSGFKLSIEERFFVTQHIKDNCGISVCVRPKQYPAH